MFGSWSLGRLRGIDIRVHFTFLLYLGLFALFDGLFAAVFLALVFGCVLLHELGHSVVAQAFGVPVRRILLTPIGGVAELGGPVRHWTHEIAIALAGPLVNFLLVAALMPLGLLLPTSGVQTMIMYLAWANVVLGVFNLLPAFPMDGGRVLRAWWTPRFGALRATLRAVSVGKWIALALGLFGLFSGHFMLILVAGFVWLMGRSERFAALRAHAHGRPVGGFEARPRHVIYVDRRAMEPW